MFEGSSESRSERSSGVGVMTWWSFHVSVLTCILTVVLMQKHQVVPNFQSK